MAFDRIRDPLGKVTCITSVLTSVREQDFRALVDADRDPNKSYRRLGVIVLAQMLGLPENHFNAWETKSGQGGGNQNKPNPGTMLMVATVAGFAPIDTELMTVEAAFDRHRQCMFPDNIYEAMSEWDQGGIRGACWRAFVGQKDEIVGDRMLKKILGDDSFQRIVDGYNEKNPPVGRGLSQADFGQVFTVCIDSMAPSLPARAYRLGPEEGKSAPPLLSESRSTRGIYIARSESLILGNESEEVIVCDAPENPVTRPHEINVNLQGFASTAPSLFPSPLTTAQKFSLYGGAQSNIDLHYTPIEHVAAGHTFRRTMTDEVLSLLDNETRAFTDVRIRANHGEGLSICLSQIALSLISSKDYLPLWVIGDTTRSDEACKGLKSELVAEFLTSGWPSLGGSKRLVVIIDDASSLSIEALRNLNRFAGLCQEAASRRPALKIAIIYGTFGEFAALGENDDLRLKLTSGDELACYHMMANEQPNILAPNSQGLTGIQEAHPEYRNIGDDTQSFIDYLLEFGDRSSLGNPRWLVPTKRNLPALSQEMLIDISLIGILDLPLQENVALKRARDVSPLFIPDLAALQSGLPGIAIVQREWRGLALSSARRAQANLNILGLVDSADKEARLISLIRTGLTCSMTREVGADHSLEFARHIMQRLTKTDLYKFQGKANIAVNAIDLLHDEICHVTEASSSPVAAKWAGSLSGLLPLKARNDINVDEQKRLLRLISLVLDLSERAIESCELVGLLEPQEALSLMRALRRAMQSGLEEGKVKSTAIRLDKFVTHRRAMDLIMRRIQYGGSDVEYRVNELIHTIAQFKDAMSGNRHSSNHKTRLFGWFLEFEKTLRQHGLALDSASWMQRATYAVGPNRSYYLKNALSCAQFDCRTQGTWIRKIKQQLSHSRKESGQGPAGKGRERNGT